MVVVLHPDPRGYQVALVADGIVNDGAASFDVLAILGTSGFGVVILPPADFTISTIAGIVEYAVDDLVDYRTSGYRVVAVGSSSLEQFGVWDDLISGELARRSIEPFERFDVNGASSDEFAAFLGSSVPGALTTA